MHCKRNIIVNALVSYARHSSTLSAFTTAASRFLGRLHTQYGYPLPFLRATLRLFYCHHGSQFVHLPPWGSHLLRSLLAAFPPPASQPQRAVVIQPAADVVMSDAADAGYP